MPTYELIVLLRTMSKPEIVSTLKRSAQEIFDKGGFLRKLENLGTKTIPYRVSSHGLVHKQASYFMIQFDSPPHVLSELLEVYGRDVDLVRRNIFKVQSPPQFDCTLSEELKPPAYRKEVQEMIEIGKRKQKPKFQQNTNLDYYPFQR